MWGALLVGFFIFGLAFAFVFSGMANSMAYGCSKVGLAFIVIVFLAGAAQLIPFQLSPVILLPVIFGLPMTLARFRAGDDNPYFASVSPQARVALGISWLVLVVYLVIATVTTEQALTHLVR